MQKRSFRNGRLSEFALREIQRMITEEYRAPGSRLPKEEELADRLHVSRIVIREAMKILEDRGVVEVRAGRGTHTVAPKPDRVKESLLRLFGDQPMPTIQDMEHLLELRQVLEETTARLAAIRATADDLTEIEAALHEMKQEDGNVDCTVAADLRFHRSLMRAAHNPLFEMVLDPLMEVFLHQIKLTISFNTRWEQHRRIFLEIQAHNPIGARQAVRRLMKVTMAETLGCEWSNCSSVSIMPSAIFDLDGIPGGSYSPRVRRLPVRKSADQKQRLACQTEDTRSMTA